jgi:uncharacterized protein YxjI
VLDDRAKEKYKVGARSFKLGECFSILDEEEKELAIIRKFKFPFVSVYHISANKKEIAVMENHICATKPSYHIIGMNWTLKTGAHPHLFFIFTNNGDPIASQAKIWKNCEESYELEISDEKFEILCLSIAICVDSLLICGNKIPALS